MYCKKCGAQNPDGAAFCSKCGAPLSAAPAPSGTVPQNGMKGGKSKKPLIFAALAVVLVAAVAVGLAVSRGKAGDSDDRSTSLAASKTDQTDGSGGNKPGISGEDPESVSAGNERKDSAPDGMTEVKEDHITVKKPGLDEAFGEGFYEEYTMYGASAKPVIEDAGGDSVNYSIRYTYQNDSGQEEESFITAETKFADGLFPDDYCEVNADLYAYCVHDLGMSESEAQDYNTALQGKMPVTLSWGVDDVNAAGTRFTIFHIINRLSETDDIARDDIFMNALYRSLNIQVALYYQREYVTIRPEELSGARVFTDSFLYFPWVYGDETISNSGYIYIPPSYELVQFQIYKKEDGNGNVTQVLRTYEDDCFEYRYTYNERNQLWTCAEYEYLRGQKPEDVGAHLEDEYAYDVDGRLFSVTRHDIGMDSEMEFSYDDQGRLIKMVAHKDGDADLEDAFPDTVTQLFEYDEEGKVGRVIVEELITDGRTYIGSPRLYRIYLPVK